MDQDILMHDICNVLTSVYRKLNSRGEKVGMFLSRLFPDNFDS